MIVKKWIDGHVFSCGLRSCFDTQISRWIRHHLVTQYIMDIHGSQNRQKNWIDGHVFSSDLLRSCLKTQISRGIRHLLVIQYLMDCHGSRNRIENGQMGGLDSFIPHTNSRNSQLTQSTRVLNVSHFRTFIQTKCSQVFCEHNKIQELEISMSQFSIAGRAGLTRRIEPFHHLTQILETSN